MTRLLPALAALFLIAAPARPDPPHRGHITTEDGTHLHYELLGTAPDTLIVLHGGPGLSSSYLVPDFGLLAESHTLIFYDQRGAGGSTVVTDSTRLRLADHVGDLDAVRRHFGLDRMTLLGHSWGAGLAAHYARAHPDRVARMILVGSIPPRAAPYMEEFGRNLRAWMDSTTAARFETLAEARHTSEDPVAACRAFWEVFLRGYFADPHDLAVLARMRGDVCDAPADAIRNARRVSRSVLGPFGEWDWREDFRDVRTPVLVLHGEKDPIPVASAAEWRDAFPAATLVELEGAGHFPHVDQPEAFLRSLEEFLRRPPVRHPAAARVVAIGDLHGDLDATTDALRLAGAIDDEWNWIGGDLVVVQTGDQLDRGNQEQEIVDRFERLAAEARAHGGAVHALNGNHELMNVALDLRYVTPEGFADFEDAVTVGEPDSILAALAPEQRARAAAFRPGGTYARRLADRPIAVIVGRTLFVHGSIDPENVEYGLDRINAEARRWLLGEAPEPDWVHGEHSPVWSRRFSDDVDDEDCETLSEVLDRLGVDRMVVGHTVQEEGIRSHCDRRIWCIDVGMAAAYGGSVEALEIVGDDVRVLRAEDEEDAP